MPKNSERKSSLAVPNPAIAPMRSFAVVAIGVALASACACPLTPAQKVSAGRQALLKALEAQHAFTAPRRVVHLSHVCNLVIGGTEYPVIDLQELVPGAMVPRGANAILILKPDLHLLRRIEYTGERPLFCRMERLYVWGDLAVDGVHGAGNVLTLSPEGNVTSLGQLEANDVPAPVVGREPVH